MQDFKAAIPILELAIDLQPDHVDDSEKGNCFYYQGMCHEQLKDFKTSILCFKKCLASDGNHFDACIHLANLLTDLSEGQRAIRYYKHALKIDPNSVAALFALGKI
jgi:tetratricopeptide (TPR) repeat protein